MPFYDVFRYGCMPVLAHLEVCCLLSNVFVPAIKNAFGSCEKCLWELSEMLKAERHRLSRGI